MPLCTVFAGTEPEYLQSVLGLSFLPQLCIFLFINYDHEKKGKNK